MYNNFSLKSTKIICCKKNVIYNSEAKRNIMNHVKIYNYLSR